MVQISLLGRGHSRRPTVSGVDVDLRRFFDARKGQRTLPRDAVRSEQETDGIDVQNERENWTR